MSEPVWISTPTEPGHYWMTGRLHSASLGPTPVEVGQEGGQLTLRRLGAREEEPLERFLRLLRPWELRFARLEPPAVGW